MTAEAVSMSARPQIGIQSAWPRFEADEREAALKVLTSGKVNALVHGGECEAFAAEFAEFLGVPHAICMANGTVTLGRCRYSLTSYHRLRISIHARLNE